MKNSDNQDTTEKIKTTKIFRKLVVIVPEEEFEAASETKTLCLRSEFAGGAEGIAEKRSERALKKTRRLKTNKWSGPSSMAEL